MPKISQEEVNELMALLQNGLPHEKYPAILDKFKQLTEKAIAGESEDQYTSILNDFITKARNSRSGIIMWPILALGKSLNATRSGEKQAQLSTILNCGDAIWGTSPWNSRPNPQALLNILLGLVNQSVPKKKLGA